jgi:hypothetical protein
MKIQSTQFQPIQSPSVESLVGNQKQEYPKPSVPPKLPSEQPVTTPVEQEYNGKANELKNTLEANIKNYKQDLKEEVMDYTPSLTDGQTLGLKVNSVNKQIEAYQMGSGNSQKDIDIKLSQENMNESIKLYKEEQNKLNQQNGVKAYQELLGISSN